MTSPFDFSRFDWYPAGLGGPGQVSMSDGRPRPALACPLNTFGVHYAGAGSSWLDSGDTIDELLSVELNHARPSGKPNEYNSVSDIDSATFEYAGPYRAAHSGGNNDTVWGHLTLYGLEVMTEDQATRLIVGIRRARRQAVAAGYLTPDHQVLGHQELAGANTGCPGPLFTNKRWWAQITAPLSTFTPPPPPLPQPAAPTATPTETNDDDMLNDIVLWKKKGTANLFAVSLSGGAHQLSPQTAPVLIAKLEAAGHSTQIIETAHKQEIACVLHHAGLAESDLIAL